MIGTLQQVRPEDEHGEVAAPFDYSNLAPDDLEVVRRAEDGIRSMPATRSMKYLQSGASSFA